MVTMPTWNSLTISNEEKTRDMRKHLLYLFAAALLTVACSGDDTAEAPSVGSTEQVNFSASVADEGDAVTRTPANAIESATNEYFREKGFGVFGCYTGLRKFRESSVSPDFMYNEHVIWNTSTHTWEYTPLKYWPSGEGDVDGTSGQLPHYVSFFAYAPYSDGDDKYPATNTAGYCIPSFSHQGEPGNPWVTYRLHTDVDKQVDLLCADPLLDQTKPDKAERLQFQFNHALACVGDRVSIDCSSAMRNELDGQVDGIDIKKVRVELTKLEIEYTLTSKARLVLWNGGEPNWELIYSEDPVCTRTVKLVDAEAPGAVPVYVYEKEYNVTPTTIQKGWNDKGIYYIPIEQGNHPQTAQVTIAYKKSTFDGDHWSEDDAVIEGTVSILLHNYSAAFEPGKHLYINVSINDLTFTVTAAIADWTPGNGEDGENVEAI